MRAKLIFSLPLVVCLGLLAIPALAQEDGLGKAEIQELNSHQELNLNDDKTLIMDADAKPPKVTSATLSQGNAKKQETQQKSSGSSSDKIQEDPLSFNFLYFIIQKFKISDIVDN